MTFNEFDAYVNKKLGDKYGENSERRDYRELELKNPSWFKGYSKTSGLMYLVDVDDGLYIDINIFESNYRMVLRHDDHDLISREVSKFDNKNIDYFLKLVDEYNKLTESFRLFNSGEFDKCLIRDMNIDNLIGNDIR